MYDDKLKKNCIKNIKIVFYI